MPTWNSAAFIEGALASLLTQTYPNLRILITDDASTDDTVAICRRVAAGDDRVDIQVRDENAGWTANINSLLGRVQGPYVFISPHDDMLHPEYVARMVEVLESDPDAILAFADTDVIRADGSIDKRRYDCLDGEQDTVTRAMKIMLQRGVWWIPFRGVFRSRVLSECPGLERGAAGEFSADWPWLLGLALRGRFRRVPGVLCRKHLRKDSVSKSWTYDLSSWVAVNRVCRAVVRRSSLTLPEKLFLYLVSALYVPKQALGLLAFKWRQRKTAKSCNH